MGRVGIRVPVRRARGCKAVCNAAVPSPSYSVGMVAVPQPASSSSLVVSASLARDEDNGKGWTTTWMDAGIVSARIYLPQRPDSSSCIAVLVLLLGSLSYTSLIITVKEVGIK